MVRRTRRQQVARSTSRTVQHGREARAALLRVVEFTAARSRLELVERDGTEVPDRVRLTDAERTENLSYALTWLQAAEQTMRLLRVELERLHEYHLNEVLR